MTTTKKPRRMARPAPDAQQAGADAASPPTSASAPAKQKRPTKQDLVLTLLQGEGGAPLSAIVEATGWLPHTVRAALTGLRKKGHGVTRTKVDGETRYALEAAAVQ